MFLYVQARASLTCQARAIARHKLSFPPSSPFKMGGTFGRTHSKSAFVPLGAAPVSFVELFEIQTKIDACPDCENKLLVCPSVCACQLFSLWASPFPRSFVSP